MGKLRLEQRVLGPVSTNVYLAVNTETNQAFLVDPADNADFLEDWILRFGVSLKAILLTHGHFDHIGAVSRLKADLQVPVYAMQAEKALLEDPNLNLSANWGRGYTAKADRFLKDGDVLEIAGFSVNVYHTPGHTKGGGCYYLPGEKALFSGDTIFCESIGRSDFPTGNAAELVRSAKRVLAALPEDVKIYPGHDEATSVAHELKYNPFL